MTRITLSAYDKWLNSESDDEYIPNWYDRLDTLFWKIKCTVSKAYHHSIGWYIELLMHRRKNDIDYRQFMENWMCTGYYMDKPNWISYFTGDGFQDDMDLLQHKTGFDKNKPVRFRIKCAAHVLWTHYVGRPRRMKYLWDYRWGTEHCG